jgi:hypothetical protein
MIASKKESAPAKKRPGRWCQYHIAAFLADLFGQPFWFWEQRRTRLLDLIDNERGAGQ